MNLSAFVGWLLYSSATAGILVLFILAAKKLTGSLLGPKGQYLIWFLVFIKLLVPYTIESHISAYNLFNILEEKTNIKKEAVIQNFALPHTDQQKKNNLSDSILPDNQVSNKYKTAKNSNTAERTESTTYFPIKFETTTRDTVISLIWLLGAFVTGVLILSRDLRFWLKIRKCSIYENPDLNMIISECRLKLHIKREITPVLSGEVSFPSIYGILQPKLILPSNSYERLSNIEMKYIVLHELSHVKRQDIAVNVVSSVLKVLHWFNPIIRAGLNKMKYDMEVACDAKALSYVDVDEYKNYGLTMVSLLNGIPMKPVKITEVAGFLHKKSQMKGRIIMISLFKKNSYKLSALALAIIFTIGATGLTAPIKAAVSARPEIVKNNPGKKLVFKDIKLQECIASYIALQNDKPIGKEVYAEDAGKLKELKLYGVSNIEGIEYCTDLENLNFERCKVSNISPIIGLSKLKDLNIAYNDINPDLSPLKSMAQLENLRLDNVQNFKFLSSLTKLKSFEVINMSSSITNLKDLKSCIELETLNLTLGDNVSDIHAISEMKNLKELHMALNGLNVDISPLKELKNIETLEISKAPSNNQSGYEYISKLDFDTISALSSLKTLTINNLKSDFKELGQLSQMKGLKNLEIQGNGKIDDLTWISKLTELETLSFCYIAIADISPLSSLKNLKSLDLTSNSISDILPLSGLTKLESLYLRGNNIKDITSVQTLTNLKQLLLSDNQITDISALKQLINLDCIWLFGNKITDITPLTELKKLKHLLLQKNNIKNTAPLSGLTSLEELRLDENQIVDIEPLKNLKNIIELHLSKNNISDIRPLSGLKKPTHIFLDNNNIEDINPLSGAFQLFSLDLRNNKIKDIGPLSTLSGATYLFSLKLAGNNIKDYSPVASFYNKLTYKDFKLAPKSGK
jgi:beta-lactamase regulating signal transducer with metallopeptidase domain/Leucine-rich repeat (LRR) protein